MAKDDVETKLRFLEEEITGMEREWQEHEEEDGKETVYISDEEHERCRKVADAYADELADAGVVVVDAGRYGFVRLTYYKFPDGFGDAVTYADSFRFFFDFWDEWLEEQLLRLTKDTPMAELDYGELFRCLPEDKQAELMKKREYFAEKAGIRLA